MPWAKPLFTPLRNIMAVVQQPLRLIHNNIVREVEQQKLLSGGDKNVSVYYGTSRPSSRGSVKSNILPTYRYTKKELLCISKFPLAKKRPEYLDPKFNNSSGLWNPLNWSSTIRKYEQSLREILRLKCEKSCNTGIFYGRTPAFRQRILNPQKRVLGTCCRVPRQVLLSKRSRSPLELNESQSTIPLKSSRKPGSVTIVMHDKDQCGEDKDSCENDYRYNKQTEEREDNIDQENKENESQYDQFSEHGERFEKGQSEEPKQFVEGPTSQSGAVELVGLHEFQQNNERKERRQSTGSPGTVLLEVQRESKSDEVKTEEELESKETSSFDINELFKSDFLSRLIPSGTSDEPLVSQGVASSRFTQWFQRGSPSHTHFGSCSTSRRSSFQDELMAHVLCDALGIRDETSPTLSTSFHGEDSFPSVSPVFPQNYSQKGYTHQKLQQNGNKNILELLQVATLNLESYLSGELDKMKEYEKMIKVEEMEDDLKKLLFGQEKEEDQIGQNRELPVMKSILEMDKSVQAYGSNLLSNLSGNTPTPLLPNVTSALIQNRIQSSPPQLSSGIQNAQALVDEKQKKKVLLSLQKCPRQQPHGSLGQSSVIPTTSNGLGKHHSLPYTGQGHISSIVPFPSVFGQWPSLSQASIYQPHLSRNSSTLLAQPAFVSPRVPSPQELAIHTQSILQNALIKKKLEEQKRNFKQQQNFQWKPSTGVSSVMNKPASVRGILPKRPSPTMAAFTPTSVMRKMQTEKKERVSIKQYNQPDSVITEKDDNTGFDVTSVLTVNSDTTEPGQCPTQFQGDNIANGGQSFEQKQIPTKGGGVVTSSQTTPGPGRPIVKGSTGQDTAGGPLVRGGDQTVTRVPRTKLTEQQCILQQQAQTFLAAQRQLNALIPPATFGMGPTGLNASMVRPGSIGLGSNLNLILLQNIVQNNLKNPNIRGPWTMNYLAYLLAFQQQRGLDIRQLQALAHAQGIHPLICRQLPLLYARNQAAMVSSTPNLNPMSTGDCFGNLAGSRPHLPIQGPSNQQSPVNLVKWFGSDILKQKMPDMPPVFQQRAYLAEELERLQ